MAYPDANPLRDIVIHDAAIATDETGTHAEYCVQVALTGREWEVRRRYRQFLNLDDALRAKYGAIMTRMPFPPKMVFSVSRSVMRGRCRDLQRYLLGVASVSVPVRIGSRTALVRMREFDDFLEVAQHLHAPVDRSNPRFSRPAGGLGSAATESGGAGPETAEGMFHDSLEEVLTAASAARGGRRVWVRENVAAAADGSVSGRTSSSGAAGLMDAIAAAAARQAVRQGRSAFDAAVEAVVCHAVGRVLEPGCGTREARTVERFLEQHRSSPDQAPDAALVDVRDTIEDLAAWVAHHRAEELAVVLQDARAAALAAARAVGDPAARAMVGPAAPSAAATGGRGWTRTPGEDVDGGARAGPAPTGGARGTPPGRERAGSAARSVLRLDSADTDGSWSEGGLGGPANGSPPRKQRQQPRGFRSLGGGSGATAAGAASGRGGGTDGGAAVAANGPGQLDLTRGAPAPATPSPPGSDIRRMRATPLPGVEGPARGASEDGDGWDGDGGTPEGAESAEDDYGREADADDDAEPWQLGEDDVDDDTRLLRRGARLAVERAVILPQAADLLYRAQQCAGASDAVFAARLSALRGAMGALRPDQFGVGDDVARVTTHPAVTEARAHLQSLEQMPTPTLMAGSLLLAVRCVYAALASLQEGAGEGGGAAAGVAAAATTASAGPLPNPSAAGSVGADDFLPMFLWCVATSGLTRPATCEAFIHALTPAVDFRGELAYYCTTLEGAVFYVSRLEVREPEAAARREREAASPPSGWGWFRGARTSDAPARGSGPGTPLHASAGGAGSSPLPASLTSPRPFRTVHLVDPAFAGASGSPSRDRRVSMNAAAFAASTGGRPLLVPARALRHPAFRAVDAPAAASFLAGAAFASVQARLGRPAPGAASSRRDMVSVGPSAGWLWVLHPVAPMISVGAANAAVSSVPGGMDAPAEAPAAGILGLSFLPLPPRAVAGCSASLRPDAPAGPSGAAATPAPAPHSRSTSASTRPEDAPAAAAALTAAAGGAWASMFDAGGTVGGGGASGSGAAARTRSTDGGDGGADSAAATEAWTRAGSASNAASLEPLVRRLFVARQSDERWFFLPPRGRSALPASAPGAARPGTSGPWPPLSEDPADWRWSGPFPSLQACVVWCQTTYEGVGSADLKRVQPADGARQPTVRGV